MPRLCVFRSSGAAPRCWVSSFPHPPSSLASSFRGGAPFRRSGPLHRAARHWAAAVFLIVLTLRAMARRMLPAGAPFLRPFPAVHAPRHSPESSHETQGRAPARSVPLHASVWHASCYATSARFVLGTVSCFDFATAIPMRIASRATALQRRRRKSGKDTLKLVRPRSPT